MIPCLYLSESPVHLLLHLFLSSYYNFTKCTVYEKAKKFRLYLPRSLLSTHLMHGLICNVCYYITCIYCTTKSLHRTFSGSIVLLGREPCGLIRVSNHTFWGLPYGRFGYIVISWKRLLLVSLTCFGENIKRRERFQKLMMIQNQKRWRGGGGGGGGVLYI